MAQQMLGRSTQRGQETDKAVHGGLTELLDGVARGLLLGSCRASGLMEAGASWPGVGSGSGKRASVCHHQSELELLRPHPSKKPMLTDGRVLTLATFWAEMVGCH